LSLKKKVCLPKVQDGKIAFYQIDGLNDLKIGIYNINEPQPTNDVKDEKIDTLIVPGIVFNKHGYRIGYGKGYYDRFLAQFSENGINIIGLGYDFQIFNGLINFEPHDFKMTVLVTNNEIVVV
jgi:5-formyltetrahydrofolate cyclo-ligase